MYEKRLFDKSVRFVFDWFSLFQSKDIHHGDLNYGFYLPRNNHREVIQVNQHRHLFDKLRE
jgi:hypothetical protein